MSTREQEGDSVLTVYDSEDARRVCFYQHSDRTFGFLEWKFLMPEDSWVMTRIGEGARLPTIEEAIREAKGRVEWLSSAMALK